jgi:hypothetical protein
MLIQKPIYGWAESLVCDVPSWTKDQEVGKGHTCCLRFGREDAEDGRIDVVFRYTADVDKLLHRVLFQGLEMEEMRSET